MFSLIACLYPQKHLHPPLGLAPDVIPVSRIPVFCSLLLITFHAQCSATLLTRLVTVVVVIAMSTLIVVSISNVSFCSMTRQESEDQ